MPEQDKTPALNVEQRAARALRVYGYGPSTIETSAMAEAEQEAFAAAVDGGGAPVEGSREIFDAAWHAYFDARKAQVDQAEDTDQPSEDE